MYDLLIIGGGPTALTASIYSSCFGLKSLVIGKVIGGQLILAPDIINYPGFEEIAGTELTQKILNQAKKRGGEVLEDSVAKIEKMETGFKVFTDKAKEYEGRTIILATGVERRKLNVPGEVEYTGKGIEYCAKGGKFDYLNAVAAIVGGANAAAQTAAQVAHSAKKVYIIYRGSELRSDEIWKKHINEHPNIEVLNNTIVMEIIGDGQKVTSLKLQTKKSQNQSAEEKILNIDKLFIEIGGVPGTALLIPLGVKMDPGGFITVDEKLETSIPGIFAAGDVVSHQYSIEQITSAVGSGARAATYVFSHLKQKIAPSLWGTSQIKR